MYMCKTLRNYGTFLIMQSHSGHGKCMIPRTSHQNKGREPSCWWSFTFLGKSQHACIVEQPCQVDAVLSLKFDSEQVIINRRSYKKYVLDDLTCSCFNLWFNIYIPFHPSFCIWSTCTIQARIQEFMFGWAPCIGEAQLDPQRVQDSSVKTVSMHRIRRSLLINILFLPPPSLSLGGWGGGGNNQHILIIYTYMCYTFQLNQIK